MSVMFYLDDEEIQKLSKEKQKSFKAELKELINALKRKYLDKANDNECIICEEKSYTYNAETINAIEDASNGIEVKTMEDIDDWFGKNFGV